MKIFHTSDWHLGQSFYYHSRDYEHVQFLQWLTEQIRERQPDVLLIAGDVFDTVNPPMSAQRMLYEFLASLHRLAPQLHIIMIAGNHDSGGRIELPAPLLSHFNTHVIGRLQRPDDAAGIEHLLIPLQVNGQVQGYCVALPYLRPAEVSQATAQDDVMQGAKQLYTHLWQAVAAKRQAGQVVIAMTHAHLRGGQTSDSERNIVIGAAEAMPCDWFDQSLDYVALGHLHKPQRVGGQDRIRYSGSPIPLSFSERNYPHQILDIELTADQPPQITPILIPRSVPMLRFPSTGAMPLAQLLAELQTYAWPAVTHPAQRAWLEVMVEIEGPAPPDLRQSIEAVLPLDRVRLLRLRHQQHGQPIADEQPDAQHSALAEHLPAPTQLFEKIWQQRYGELDPQVMQDFARLLQLAEQADVDAVEQPT